MSGPGFPPFDAVVMRGDGIVLVRVSGELDCATAPDLAEALDEALRDHPTTVIVDLRGVTFLDPAGARPLRSLNAKPEPRTRLRLRGAKGPVRRVLELLDMSVLLDA